MPNCASPASTPQRLIATGKSNACPYSTATVSDASFVAPYSEIGASVEKASDNPAGDAPVGHAADVSGTNAGPSTTTGSRVSACTL